MILLVDTDILIDVALDRMPYAESSSALLEIGSNRLPELLSLLGIHSQISIISSHPLVAQTIRNPSSKSSRSS